MPATLLAVAAVLAASAPAPPDTAAGSADSARVSANVVRLEPFDVRALLPDILSHQTAHPISGQALEHYPLDGFADAVALQAGVVAQAGDLHVRGGRAGETVVSLNGITLNEPQRMRPPPLPLLAVSQADLVSGAPEARLQTGLAGTLTLQTVNPSPKPTGRALWQSDARTGTHFDRVAAVASTPLPLLGLGIVAAGDALLDDTYLPYLRTTRRQDVLGMSFGWRAENRMLGYFKVAPVQRPDRFSAQVFVSREVLEPYSPNWSLDGWTFVPVAPKAPKIYSPAPLEGFQRYRAADHMGITDERRIAAILSSATNVGPARLSASAGWTRTRHVQSTGGGYEDDVTEHRASYGPVEGGDGFYVVWGDYPIYREAGSDVYSIRVDGDVTRPSGSGVRAGAGMSREEVSMFQYEWYPISWIVDDASGAPLDSLRRYDATAPSAFGYVQGRWHTGGLILNAGLRADYFTPGAAATEQTLPGVNEGQWSMSPRLGISFPISTRDVFSLAYVRVHQPPGRDFLYDDRQFISNRLPLGNPAIRPSTVISYEAAVKRLLSNEWALQTSVFYRDVFGVVGSRSSTTAQGVPAPIFIDADEAHATGFEFSLIHAAGERGRFEARYTWLQAWGNESFPEGQPFGPLRGPQRPPIDDAPLHWDRTHSILVAGFWRLTQQWSVAWSTNVASPFPWTPKARREPFTDFQLVNTERLGWTENTNLSVQWCPLQVPWATIGLDVRNLFDHRGDVAATLDGFPSPYVNTLYDDYGAYRTETGMGGGAYWSNDLGQWVPVHDARLGVPPRAVRMSIAARW